MRKKGILLTLLCLLVVLTSSAQTSKLTADSILARTLRVADSDSTREARIVMTSLRNGKTERSYGMFSWKRDHVIMSFYDSVNTGFLANRFIQVGDTFWIYNGQRNDVQIVDANLSTTENRLDGTFNVGRSGFQKPVLDTMFGDSIAVLTLIPIHAASKLKVAKVVQRIDVRTYRLIEQTMYKPDGTSISVKFDYVQINKPIDPAVFQFKESHYPEYLDVFDNRKKK